MRSGAGRSHEDRHLFEMLILEGAQAGLSWSTILRKRANYKRAFASFDPRKVARFDARRRAALLRTGDRAQPAEDRLDGDQRPGVPGGAAGVRLFRPLPVGFRRRAARSSTAAGRGRLPASTALSDRISKDLKKRGFRFVGTTIIYAYLQAVGVVNDHTRDCFLRPPAVGSRRGRLAAAAGRH